MPARKKRADKYGAGVLTKEERIHLLYWFHSEDDLIQLDPQGTVRHDRGHEPNRQELVKGLVTKGYLTKVTHAYGLTERGRDLIRVYPLR